MYQHSSTCAKEVSVPSDKSLETLDLCMLTSSYLLNEGMESEDL